MGRDNHPRERQARQLARKSGQCAIYERVLIVCEGSRTEPLYFRELRAHYRLHAANVEVRPSEYGTSPLQVVEYAQALFERGDPHARLKPSAFDRVYAVFDRDEHASYHDALKLAESLDGRLHSDEKRAVRFEAVASVPNFELWLLLHFEDVRTPLHRDEVIARLRQYLPDYEKGTGGHFNATRHHLPKAVERARWLAERHNRNEGNEPCTDIAPLIDWLCKLKA